MSNSEHTTRKRILQTMGRPKVVLAVELIPAIVALAYGELVSLPAFSQWRQAHPGCDTSMIGVSANVMADLWPILFVLFLLGLFLGLGGLLATLKASKRHLWRVSVAWLSGGIVNLATLLVLLYSWLYIDGCL